MADSNYQLDAATLAQLGELQRRRREYLVKQGMRRIGTLGASMKGESGVEAYAAGDPWEQQYMGRKDKLGATLDVLPDYTQAVTEREGLQERQFEHQTATEADLARAQLQADAATSVANANLQQSRYEFNSRKLAERKGELQNGTEAGRAIADNYIREKSAQEEAHHKLIADAQMRAMLDPDTIRGMVGFGAASIIGPDGPLGLDDPDAFSQAFDADGTLRAEYSLNIKDESRVPDNIRLEARQAASVAISSGSEQGLAPEARVHLGALEQAKLLIADKYAGQAWRLPELADKVGVAGIIAEDAEIDGGLASVVARAKNTSLAAAQAEVGDLQEAYDVEYKNIQQGYYENTGPSAEALTIPKDSRASAGARLKRPGGEVGAVQGASGGVAAPAAPYTPAPSAGAPIGASVPPAAPADPIANAHGAMRQAAEQGVQEANRAATTAQQATTPDANGNVVWMGVKVPAFSSDPQERFQQQMEIMEQYPEHPPFIDLRNNMLASPKLDEYMEARGYSGMNREMALRRMQREYRWKAKEARVKDRENAARNMALGVEPPAAYDPIGRLKERKQWSQEAADEYDARNMALTEKPREEPKPKRSRLFSAVRQSLLPE